jgi:hypothetical protein
MSSTARTSNCSKGSEKRTDASPNATDLSPRQTIPSKIHIGKGLDQSNRRKHSVVNVDRVHSGRPTYTSDILSQRNMANEDFDGRQSALEIHSFYFIFHHLHLYRPLSGHDSNTRRHGQTLHHWVGIAFTHMKLCNIRSVFSNQRDKKIKTLRISSLSTDHISPIGVDPMRGVSGTELVVTFKLLDGFSRHRILSIIVTEPLDTHQNGSRATSKSACYESV